jgi:hypothetical protein
VLAAFQGLSGNTCECQHRSGVADILSELSPFLALPTGDRSLGLRDLLLGDGEFKTKIQHRSISDVIPQMQDQVPMS